MATVTISFTVDSEKDRDLVRWLDSLPRRKRSEAIREALRAHLGRGGVTLGDVYQAVKTLERKLGTGMVVASASVPDPDREDAPADVLAALDSLGL
jgi:Arc/MetJ-type ribon-helix-helix transcriptional regulator